MKVRFDFVNVTVSGRGGAVAFRIFYFRRSIGQNVKLICNWVIIFQSIVIYYERKVIPSVCRLFLSAFTDSELPSPVISRSFSSSPLFASIIRWAMAIKSDHRRSVTTKAWVWSTLLPNSFRRILLLYQQLFWKIKLKTPESIIFCFLFLISYAKSFSINIWVFWLVWSISILRRIQRKETVNFWTL